MLNQLFIKYIGFGIFETAMTLVMISLFVLVICVFIKWLKIL